MSVRVLIGPAGSGKTHRCMEALRASERAGKPAMLLVPDQFTYAADRLLLEDGSLAGIRFIRVLSFRRLIHLLDECLPEQGRVLSEQRRRVLSEQCRRMLLRRILHNASLEELGPLAQVRHTPGFVPALAATIKEIKEIAGPDAAARLAELAQDNAKIAALAGLVQAYDQAREAAGMSDPEERIHQVAARLRSAPGPWAQTTVWVDGFASFTPGEKQILEALARVAGETNITLCCDPRDAADILIMANEAAELGIHPASADFLQTQRHRISRPAFLPTLRTLLWLNEALGGAIVTESIPERPHRFHQGTALARLEAELFRNDHANTPGDPAGDVSLIRHAHPYNEVLAWARLIDRRTRVSPEPIRYRNIAVLIRDLESYRPILREVFRQFGIPFFIDERRDATAHPLVRLCLSALQVASQRWSRETVISMIRNPILGLTQDTVDRIEYLSIEYGIEYERWWETDWETFTLPERERLSRARGIDTGDVDDQQDALQEEIETQAQVESTKSTRPDAVQRRRQLSATEARTVSSRLFPRLRAFTEIWRSREPTYAEAAAALINLLRTCLREAAPGLSLTSWSQHESKQIITLLEETLVTGTELMGSVPVSAGSFTRLLRDAFSGASLGTTPRILDAVIIAEPRRSRVNEARCVILGGLDASSFPRPHTQDPFFTDQERQEMASRGLPVTPSAMLQAEEDPYLFYIACTRASGELILSLSDQGGDGAVQEPSPYLREVTRILGRLQEPAGADEAGPGPLAACQHTWELPARLTETLRALAPLDQEQVVSQARDRLPFAHEAIDHSVTCAHRICRPLPDALAPETAAELFPTGVITTSASRLEKFAQCPFQHFAQHVLKLQPRPEPILTPRSTGSAAHEALQRFFAEGVLPADERAAAARMRAIFAELADEEEYRIFQEDPPSAYRWKRTGHSLEEFVRTELHRLRTAAYQPLALELSFGLEPCQDADIRALACALAKGESPEINALPPLEIDIDPAAAREFALPARPWQLRLRGRIDRLDSAGGAEGPRQALIIDYKRSGKRSQIKEDLKRGLNIQVATYLLVVREILGLEPVGGIYYAFTPQPRRSYERVPEDNRLRFSMQGIYLASAKEQIDPEGSFLRSSDKVEQRDPGAGGLDPILEIVRERMANIALNILSGRIRPLPARIGRTLPCQWCDFGPVCRFDPRVHPIQRDE